MGGAPPPAYGQEGVEVGQIGAGASKPSDRNQEAFVEQQWQEYLSNTGQTGATGTQAAAAYQNFVANIPAGGTPGGTVPSQGVYTMGGQSNIMSGAANTVDLGASSGGYIPPDKSVFTIPKDKRSNTRGGTISEGTGELSGGSNKTNDAFAGWTQTQDKTTGKWSLTPKKKPKKGTISEGTGEL